ncbi:MAG: hypothetical protein SA339_03090, partial [Methanomassiliicoccus sp.]|nr:hypothetical protein [Methanomassiliicoccus sp.]
MNWTFINKPVEEMLKVKRSQVMGQPCSNWGAGICKTKNCGVECLRADKKITFFEQANMNFQVDVTYIKDREGKNIGHIEIVQDVTAKAKEAEYRTAEFAKLKNNLKKMADGDLSFEAKAGEGNAYTQSLHMQYQEVNDSLVQAKNSIEVLVDDTKKLSQAAIEGKLSTRVDASRHKGEYQRVVQGVNDTLDAVMEPLNYCTDYIRVMANGEHQELIEKEFRGDFKGLVNSINEVKRQLVLMNEQSELLIQAAKDGQLNIRGDLTRLRGGFAHIIHGMNDTLDAVVGPVNYASTYIQVMANGEDLPAIDNTYSGDFKILMANLNDVRNSLYALLEESGKLSKAAIEGKLSTRGDVNRLKGGYATIVQGVNDTLDSVIGPINEAMRIADAYSNGDLTARVSIETQGDFQQFARSLDHIGESLTDLLKEVNGSISLVSSTSQELASSAEEMNASTEQVSAAIQQISKGAQNQSAQVDETAKIMEGMSSNVTQIVSRFQSMADGAKSGAESAGQGKAAVENTVRKMQEISKVVDESAKVITVLGKRSEEIGEIVD